ncbi:uroporphyrinogen-III C-methyltransferase [Clostridium botulinum]|uniref:Uroporphyrinogen-III C-methyltransferase n=1 Tax=Clostridium botulinum TaxID=1491 RepID=A0A6B4JIH1_CLOBO|nr:uroporphyrinogen-III C-methyltransferase [Clostridium botulinum]EES48650.1 uroporphyrinogen III synthase/methyltransferase [Clostridium botulinum E1 str. 'BoNT E Beluga']MBY6759910.1 uroporphyrinogen-III C-methyltransferase [Clostridium botulinum]MBY6918820.1 uroporphyrinogen-III C-methyltransferase [Clostridium botulinum]MCR1129906.1 uroporphyrinogen-III C-methyltransferase [Clostridium botulinum]NFH67786.1 uroporphyrinogen-III C-methyltransferase [Clostridium botulinum]
MNKVYIIGTGPGDEELLTVKAVNKLKECTAVLYDRLVSNNILNYLSDSCEIYYCGKEPGAHYKTQEEINEMLVKLAKEGHVVGRVKGGDPYVFGRGGEEVLALKEENIPFEVIPGVTSPIAVLNYAGIPITHRGIAQSFHVVTGMSAKHIKSNFKALAMEEGTLVFMMGLSNLENIVHELVANGKDISTPCGVVMRGTSSKQKKVVGTLENICEKVEEAKLQSPCIIVIGEVVNLNEDLAWYEHKPLFGKNICVTRSQKQAATLKQKLRDMGAEVTALSAIEIESTASNLDSYMGDLENYDHIVFTSVNSVDIFFDYLIENKYDVRKLQAKVSAIGKATWQALERRGIICFVKAREFIGAGLIKVLKPHVKENEKVLIPCSSLAKSDIADALTEVGAEVDRVFIYDTVKGRVRNKRAFDEVDIVFFTSPSTVYNMIDMVGLDAIKEKQIIAIGTRTSKPLEELGIKAYICKEHSQDGFLNEIESFVKDMEA